MGLERNLPIVTRPVFILLKVRIAFKFLALQIGMSKESIVLSLRKRSDLNSETQKNMQITLNMWGFCL